MRAPHEQASHSLLPAPDSYLGRALHALWDDSPLILLAGFLCSATALPAFGLFLNGQMLIGVLLGALTIVPAWTALLAFVLDRVAGRAVPIVSLGPHFLRYWRSSAVLGVLVAFPILAFLATVPLLTLPQTPTLAWMGLVADIWLLGTLVALYCYAIPLIIARDAGPLASLRPAAALASRHVAATVGLVGMGILLCLTVAYLSSGLWFILPSIWATFIAANFHCCFSESS